MRILLLLILFPFGAVADSDPIGAGIAAIVEAAQQQQAQQQDGK